MPKITKGHGPTNLRADSYVEDVLENSDRPVPEQDAPADPAEPVAQAEGDGPVRPSNAASKAEWLAYCQALHPDEDLSAFSKADLIELYGKG
jgi:hypothetical protein